MALEFYKKRVTDLESDLSNTKIFLNLVIQDMRNPINNVSFAIDQGLMTIKNAQTLLQKYEDDIHNDIIIENCHCKELQPSLLAESVLLVPDNSNPINLVPSIAPKSNVAMMLPNSLKISCSQEFLSSARGIEQENKLVP